LDHVRFGHAIPQPAVAKMTMATSTGIKRPCGGRMSRFRQKTIEISNILRGALSLPLIDTNAHLAPPQRTGKLRILPINPDKVQFLKPIELKPSDEYRVEPLPTLSTVKWFKKPVSQDMNNKWAHSQAAPHHPSGHRGPHHRIYFHNGHRGSFMKRLHYSLMNLGLWEGRAVAFVLGCGIGVLLRMFWVLAIVAYRVVKRRPEEDEYTHITVFEEVEVEAPPHYTYPVDEKVAVEPETKAAEPVVAAAATNEESK